MPASERHSSSRSMNFCGKAPKSTNSPCCDFNLLGENKERKLYVETENTTHCGCANEGKGQTTVKYYSRRQEKLTNVLPIQLFSTNTIKLVGVVWVEPMTIYLFHTSKLYQH